MTDDSMAFQRRLEQHGGEDSLGGLMERILGQLLEFEVANRIGAERHERNSERQTYRNSYREVQVFWMDCLRRWRQRGLTDVQLIISDAHEGLKAAISQVFTASWQRCRVHFLRNLLACVPKPSQSLVGTLVRQVFLKPAAKAAQIAWRQVADQRRPRFPKAAELMDQAEADVLAHLQFPAAHRLKIHSTNPLERLNKEVKRRAHVVGIFPNEASIRRLIGAVLMEQNEEWLLQQRYLPQHTMADITMETATLAALPTAA